MNNKINNYIEILFDDVPKTRKAIELKEELTANLNEHFQDYLAEGKSEIQAYSLAIANMGDIDDLLIELKLTKATNEEVNRFRKKKAFMTAISIFIYIMGVAIFILLDVLYTTEEISSVILLVLVAIATGFLVYANMFIPKEIREIENMHKEIKGKKHGITRNRSYDSHHI